jgi:deazaflavin-dependent oxidoreductase (nitroreductase family)
VTESSGTGAGRPAAGIGELNAKLIDEYRANGGKLGGMFAGSDLLLLHHTGAGSGTGRVSPLAYQMVGESYAVFASRAGSAANPDWFHNVVAHPRTMIEIGTETVAVLARVAEPAERDVIWDRQKKRVPQFAEYERKAAPRKIPVIVLDRVLNESENLNAPST